MTLDDLERVAEIERASFPAPWGESVLREELSRDFSQMRVLRPGPSESIAAFINFWIVHDEVHVLTIACDPAQRRRGYARVLLEDMLVFARTRNVRYVMLEVRRTNSDAIRLYDELGFRRIGVRPRYYADDDEDAIVMMLALDGGTPGDAP